MGLELALTLAVGSALTVTVICVELEQPFASVPITEYVVVVVGETDIVSLVSPGIPQS